MKICFKGKIIYENKIEEIHKEENKTIVKISSKYGCIYGEWKDKKYPILYKEYFIEFGVDEILEWNVNLFKSSEKQYYMLMQNSQVIINGLLDTYEDYCLTLRLGGSLILIEVIDDLNNYFNNNDNIKITLPNIEIYDINLI